MKTIDERTARVGESIKHFRNHRGISASALGRSVGLQRSTISNMENGKQDILISRLFDIADALAVDVRNFLS